MRIFAILYILFTLNSLSFGQNMLRQLSTEEGLSDMHCFDIFQDSKGYLWIGTGAGVNKYDGKDIIKFDRSNGLLSDHIYAFYEDSKNRIWINNLNGEPLFIKDNIVHNRLTDPELEKLKGKSYLTGWCEDKLNRIWVSHSDGNLKVLDKDSSFIVPIFEPSDLVNERMYGVYSYNDEIIVIKSTEIEAFHAETFAPEWKFKFDDRGYFIRNLMHKEKIYLFSLNEALVFDINDKSLRELDRKDDNASIFDCRSIGDSIFLSTGLGVSILKEDIFYSYDFDKKLDDIAISAILKDTDENYWFATLENGVFGYFDTNVELSNYASFNDVVFIDQVAEDSVFVIESSWKLNLLVNNELEESIQLDKVDNNRVNKIFFRNGKLWIVDKYMLHVDVFGDYQTYHFYNRDFQLIEEHNEIVWLGSDRVYKLLDEDLIYRKEKLNRLLELDEDVCENYIINQPYCLVYQEETECLWIGGEEGLFSIKDSVLDTIDVKGSITHLELTNGLLTGINYGNGIFQYDISQEKLTTITASNGLSTDHFTGLDVDNDIIWTTHTSGICKIQQKDDGTIIIDNYGSSHGISRGGISFIEIVDNLCHFIINGIAYIIPAIDSMNDTLNVMIDTSTLIFYEDENSTIDFDCINFFFADKMKYAYRIFPLDSAWTETTSESMDLEFIPSGDYIFEIKASHPLNLISPIQRKQICIKRRWYDEAYFNLGGLILLFGLIYFLTRIEVINFSLINFKQWVRNWMEKYFDNELTKTIQIKDIKGILQFIPVHSIDYLKSSGNYLEIHTPEKQYITRMTISTAEKKFTPWQQIARVHRSYMVNFDKIEALDHKLLKIRDLDIPFSERYKPIIEKKLKI